MFPIRPDLKRNTPASTRNGSSSPASSSSSSSATQMKNQFILENTKATIKHEKLIKTISTDLELAKRSFAALKDKRGTDARELFNKIKKYEDDLAAEKANLNKLQARKIELERIELENARLRLQSMHIDVQTAYLNEVSTDDISSLVERQSEVNDMKQERISALDELQQLERDLETNRVLDEKMKEAQRKTNPVDIERDQMFEDFVSVHEEKEYLDVSLKTFVPNSIESLMESTRQEVIKQREKEKEKERAKAT